MKEELSKRNRVLVKVRTAEKEGRGIGFNELVLRLEGEVSRATVSKALDSLFDMGILESDWALEQGKWRKLISVTGDSRPLVDRMIADLNGKGLV
ncbi:MAG: hypothetical protein R6W91_00720 [Thermoplasmata archaeon]